MASKARLASPAAVPKRNPVQLNDAAKARLDHVKQALDLPTYNDAIVFLYTEWKRHLPSKAGAFPGIGEFRRDRTEDKERVPR